MSTQAQRCQNGAVVIMFSMYTVVFVALTGLAVNVYLIGNALLQQRNAVEYVAMAALKIAKDPSIPFPAMCTADELSLLNCILERAEVAGRVGVGGSQSSFFLPPGRLRLEERSNDNSCCSAVTGGVDGCNGHDAGDSDDNDDDDDDDDDFCWPAYQVTDESYAELSMGQFNPDNSGRGSFSDALPNQVRAGNFNSIKLRFHFQASTENTRMIAPLISLFGSSTFAVFSSSAIAYGTPSGGIHLAIDPDLDTGN